MSTFEKIVLAVIAIILLAFAGLYLADRSVQQGVTNFDSLTLSENLVVGGTAQITGATTQTGALAANGGFSVDTPAFTVADTSGNTGIGGTLNVTGISTLSGLLNANGGLAVDTSVFTVADATGNTVIAGTLAANGGIAVDTPAFTVADTSGDVSTTGTLGVTGLASLNGGIAVDTSNFTVSGSTGAVSTLSTLGVGDDATLSESIIYAPATTAGATSGAVSLTVDKTYYNLTPVGTLTITLATTGAVSGQLLIITNLAAQNIVIADTNIRTSTGAALTLGQYDVVAFIWTGAEWYELYLSANS